MSDESLQSRDGVNGRQPTQVTVVSGTVDSNDITSGSYVVLTFSSFTDLVHQLNGHYTLVQYSLTDPSGSTPESGKAIARTIEVRRPAGS